MVWDEEEREGRRGGGGGLGWGVWVDKVGLKGWCKSMWSRRFVGSDGLLMG